LAGNDFDRSNWDQQDDLALQPPVLAIQPPNPAIQPPNPAIQPPNPAIQPTNSACQPSTSTLNVQVEACQHDAIRNMPSRLYDPEIAATSWSPSDEFTNFREKHFRRKLTFDQVCDILEEQAVPSVDALIAPTLDPSMIQYVAVQNKFLQERDKEIAVIQRAMLNATGPLCTLHDHLEQDNINLKPADLKLILEQTLCLLGSANTQLCILRRKKVLASINKSKIGRATQPLPNAKKLLFGEDFPSIASKEAELSRGLAKNLAPVPKFDKTKPGYGSRDSRYPASSNNHNVFPNNGKYQIFAKSKNFFVPLCFNSHSSETPSIHRTMEKYNLRPCGVRNCYRNKHSVSLCSISIVSTSDKDTSGVSSNFRAGSSKPASERGNMRGSLYKRRFLQPVIFNPQKGREYASS
jgi:hypothetical protein